MIDADLRRALILAPAHAIYVSLRNPRELITAASLIPRRDLTFVGPSILEESALLELGVARPIYVASDIAMTDGQRRALAFHQRRRA